MILLSSRTYGGYGCSLSPEPYAYEGGFAVKWLIRAQIHQMRNDGVVLDKRAGDLNYNTVAPWIAWSAYLWANATQARSDGLTWERTDFKDDGCHPSPSGVKKVVDLLMNFFLTSPHTAWFRR
jgi:hypothetical protein